MFKREKYLNQLISAKDNHLIKVVTGVRRSGKSYLLNTIFRKYLLAHGIKEKQIIMFAFDSVEDIMLLDQYIPEEPTRISVIRDEKVNEKKFINFIKDRTKQSNIKYYLLLDEIQNLNRFVQVLNSLKNHDNYDIYVTGSNSRFLSSDIDTEFRGRAIRIHLLPLTFNEYFANSNSSPSTALNEYIRYGGIPLVQLEKTDENKSLSAISIYKETYLKDVIDRHPLVLESNIDETLRVIASMTSSLINPTKIEDTFKSTYRLKLSNNVIANYIKWFQEAYLLNVVNRFDIKGRKYIGSPYKIYFEDVGIRNAILNFREVDETDLIENVVYNELRYRGYNVDVGDVVIKEKTNRLDKNKKPIYVDKNVEVDFVANKGGKTVYVQVALRIDSDKKKEQEYKSLRNIPDSFKKVIIVKEEGKPYYTNEGFYRISLLDFLTNFESLD
ncbi:MAG: ATP-binding protein [Bacilli bacterium]|nr:ATP-binding protein [Bacilli bacterium]